MNHMNGIAKMVGVEMDEEFKIAETTYKITEDGVKVFGSFGWTSMGSAFFEMLAGKFEITRSPWKPKYGEIYYIIDDNGSVNEVAWRGDFYDTVFYRHGNCFRTKEEAEKNINAYLRWLNSTPTTDWRDKK